MAETEQIPAPVIEDPRVAQTIADLKHRWPAIGAAADHPLMEWFCLRAQRQSPIMPMDVFFGFHKSNLGRQAWVAPVTFRTVCGVCIGFGYSNYEPDKVRGLWWFIFVCLVIVTTFPALLTLYVANINAFHQLFSSTRNIFMFFTTVALFSGMMAEGICLPFYPPSLAARTLIYINSFITHHQWWGISFLAVVMQIFVPAAFISIQFASWYFVQNMKFVELNILFLVSGLIFFTASRIFSRMDLDARFNKLVESLSKSYDNIKQQSAEHE